MKTTEQLYNALRAILDNCDEHGNVHPLTNELVSAAVDATEAYEESDPSTAQRIHDFADDLQEIAAQGHALDAEMLSAAQGLHGIADAIEQNEADARETHR